jgi:hypothetical protein
VLRIRWSDPEQDDLTSPGDWRQPSLLLATLFWNFLFWDDFAARLPFSGPPLVYFSFISGGTLLLIALFYLGPALAAQRGKQPLFAPVEDSLGVLPALGIRICCTIFWTCWMAVITETLTRWLLSFWIGQRISPMVTGLVPCAILLYLYTTGVQGLRTSARLAWFTNKFSLAIVIAAFIRVRGGLPSAWESLSGTGSLAGEPYTWPGSADLIFYAAPLMFLASDFTRNRTRRQSLLIGLFGLALPFAGGIFLSGLVGTATYAIHRNSGSVGNFGGAVLYNDSGRFVLVKLLLIGFTLFGAVRFWARSLAGAISVCWCPRMARRIVLGGILCGTAALSVLGGNRSVNLLDALELPTRVLVATAAILGADFVVRSDGLRQHQRVDWIAILALLAGCGLPYYISSLAELSYVVTGWPFATTLDLEPWSHTWLLPAYGTSFLLCLTGRLAQRVKAK